MPFMMYPANIKQIELHNLSAGSDKNHAGDST